jgi:hypothetical protein
MGKVEKKMIRRNKSIKADYAVLLVGLIIACLSMQLIPLSAAANDQTIKYQSLNISKANFFAQIEVQLRNYNSRYGTQVVLQESETYLPLPKGEDGWYRYFSGGFGSLAVGGPENDIGQVYYFVYEQTDNSSNQEALVARLALEETLLIDPNQKTLSDNWLDSQIATNVIENRTVIGDRTLWFLSSPGEHPYYCFGILGAPEPPPTGVTIPWWTILSIVSATIGVSTFGYKMLQNAWKRKKGKNQSKTIK